MIRLQKPMPKKDIKKIIGLVRGDQAEKTLQRLKSRREARGATKPHFRNRKGSRVIDLPKDPQRL